MLPDISIFVPDITSWQPFKENKMNKRILLILGLLILISLQNTFADCLACWELKYVKITLTNNQEIKGYIKWNEVWLSSKNPEKKQFDSFHEKYIFTMENWNWEKLKVYKYILELGDHLPVKGLVTSKDSIETVFIIDIKKIERIKKESSNLQGAGDITDLDSKSIELLNKKPISWHKDQGTVSETYFLNYNEKINKDQLIEISKASDYWLKRKSYEDEGILIIMVSWD